MSIRQTTLSMALFGAVLAVALFGAILSPAFAASGTTYVSEQSEAAYNGRGPAT